MRVGNLIELSFLISDKNWEEAQDVQLLFVMEGKLSVWVTEEVVLQENDIFILGPGSVYSTKKDERALIMIFTVSTEGVMDLVQAMPIPSVTHLIQGGGDLQRLLRTILIYHMQMDAIGEIRKAEYSFAVLDRIFDICYSSNSLASESASITEADRKRRIIGYINANYNTKISLNELADNMYLSVAYLSKYIKKKLGKCFEDYVNEIRLVHAQRDLVNTDYTVTQIAMKNGFSSSNAFTRTFRKACGTTPTEYRNTFKKERTEKNQEKKEYSRMRERLELQHYFDRNPFEMEETEQRVRLRASVDAEKSSTYHKNMLDMLNLGPCKNLLDSAIQEHIFFLKKKLQFRYGRIWNPFVKMLNA